MEKLSYRDYNDYSSLINAFKKANNANESVLVGSTDIPEIISFLGVEEYPYSASLEESEFYREECEEIKDIVEKMLQENQRNERIYRILRTIFDEAITYSKLKSPSIDVEITKNLGKSFDDFKQEIKMIVSSLNDAYIENEDYELSPDEVSIICDYLIFISIYQSNKELVDEYYDFWEVALDNWRNGIIELGTDVDEFKQNFRVSRPSMKFVRRLMELSKFI